MSSLKYTRVLLKLSGEALSGDSDAPADTIIDAHILDRYAEEIRAVTELGVQVAIVIGGGNIFRGKELAATGIDRVQGDYMGMLATVINGMAVQAALEKHGLYTRLMSAINIQQVCEPFIQRRAVRHLEKGRIVIFGGGTGSPYVTTDTAAALRALEIKAEVVLKGTRVDGVYTADPEKDPTAQRFDQVSFSEVMEKGLKVMDLEAFAKCRENQLPIVVFDMNRPGNLIRLVQGEVIGTLIR